MKKFFCAIAVATKIDLFYQLIDGKGFQCAWVSYRKDANISFTFLTLRQGFLYDDQSVANGISFKGHAAPPSLLA